MENGNILPQGIAETDVVELDRALCVRVLSVGWVCYGRTTMAEFENVVPTSVSFGDVYIIVSDRVRRNGASVFLLGV